MSKISGGYYIKARKIMESKIMRSPPVVRELWDFLIMSAWFKDSENGKIKRGQILTTTSDIIEGLSWYVGYSKRGYSEKQIRSAMKVLAQGGMLVTTKVTNGVLITICNYSLYQDFRNYEGNYAGKDAGQAQVNNYKEKELEKEKKEKKYINEIEKPDDVLAQTWDDFLKHRKLKKGAVTETVICRFRQEAEKIGWTLEQAIVESCAQNWQGFKAEWVKNNKSNLSQNGTNYGTKKTSNTGNQPKHKTPINEWDSLLNPNIAGH